MAVQFVPRVYDAKTLFLNAVAILEKLGIGKWQTKVLIMNKYEQIILEIKASELYFLKGYDQGTIGRMLNCSRSTVSRLLAKAVKDGVVEVHIRNPLEKAKELERKLKRQFSLKDVVVVAGTYTDATLLRKALGVAAAELAGEIVEENDLIGICSGRTIYEMINSLASLDKKLAIKVVPLLGGRGRGEAEYQINELCREFARHFGGTSDTLEAPLVVKSRRTYDLLMEESGIKKIRERWNKLTKVFITIGPPAANAPLMLNYSELEEAERQQLKTEAVGDVCGRFIDQHGNECQTSLSQKIIGITFEQLMKVPMRIGIGGGNSKVPAVKGVLTKGLINVLVTDEETAKSILQWQ